MRLELSTGGYLDYHLTPGPNPGGTLVVFVHGYGSHQGGDKAVYFRDRVAALGAGYLAFDLRGHGASSGTMDDLTLSGGIGDLQAIMDGPAAGFGRVQLIGSSMGGQIAAWYAARFPERVAANVLIAPAFAFYENRLRDLGADGIREIAATGRARIQNQWVDLTIGRALLEDAAGYVLSELTRSYKTPTLILHGTADTTVAPEGSVTFVRRAHARPLDLVLIGGGDHRLTEHKAYLFDLMRAFWARLGRAV